MKIGINATCINDRPSGAKQRFIGIYNELFKHLNNDEFIVYEPSDCRMHSWFDEPENVVFRQTPLLSDRRLQKYFGGLLYWPRHLKSEKFDLFEGFHLPPVKAPTGRTLLTIHDIRRVVLKEYWRENALYKRTLKKSLQAADHVITVSESNRNDMLELFPETPVSVIYNGIDIEAFENISKSELLKVRQRYNLYDSFLLAVGHFEGRKNYLGLIDALDRLHRGGRSMHLVIIGNDSGEMTKVKERVQSLKLSNSVRIFNGLTDNEVRCLYHLSKLFVFPSYYEGFGIPILEAMAAKRPMVMSDIPVFQEITQGQGIYFPSDDPDAMASSIDEVLSLSSECDRLIQYGTGRVQDFSFRKIAMDLGDLYKSLMQQ